jgi:membrane associated rhomboid family serine protease
MEQTAPDPFAEPYARISARSRRQAMDWSLVLASQDIHPIIAPPDENRAWDLLVEPSQFERARAAIRQYRLENRGWAWRQEIPAASLEIHSGALLWCLFLGFVHWVITFIAPALEIAGRMDSAALHHGAWFRLFTPILLHADLAHLMANVTFGVLILGLAMARFGPGLALLTAFLCGAVGNLFGYVFYSRPYTGVGASGMMMGALGLLCVSSVGLWRRNPKAARYMLSGVLAGCFLFILFGLKPGSDILAHLGGFLGGVFFGGLLAFLPEEKLQRRTLNVAAVVALAGIIALTWSLALLRSN